MNITDSAEQVNIEAKKLKEQGTADVVIALVHDPAHTTAAKLDAKYVDFLFGGDDHIRRLDLDAAVPYAQSHEYGKVVTDLEFTYDKATKKIVSKSAKQYDSSNYKDAILAEDNETVKKVEEIFNTAESEADVLGKEVVAKAANPFVRGSNPGDAPGSNRGTESTANNMLAQSALIALENFLNTDIDFGIMNAGGVRDDIAAGDVTFQKVAEVQPFGNNIAVATLTGAQIKNMLENQWQTPENTEKSGRPRLDVGLSDNVSYIYNPNAERGQRILDIKIDGKSVDPAKEYKVCLLYTSDAADE